MSKTIGIVLALQDKCTPQLKKVAEQIGITEKELKKADAQLKKVSKELGTGLKNACRTAAIGISALTGATALMVKNTVETGDKIDKLSQKLGLSRAGFQELDFILTQNGANIDSLQSGMKTLTNSMNGVLNGNKSAIQLFRSLGVSVKDASGKVKTQEQVLKECISALQKLPDGAQKAALANQLFGRSGSELMPLLNNSAKSVEELEKRYKELGLGLSDDAVNAAVKFKDTQDQLARSFQALGMQLGSEVLPVIQEVADTIIKNMPQIKAAVSPVLKGIANSIKFVCDHANILIPVATGLLATFMAYQSITKVIAIVKTLQTAIAAVNVVQGIWNALLLANPIGLVAVAIGVLVGGIVLLWKNWDRVVASVKSAWEWLSNSKVGQAVAALNPVVFITTQLIKNWDKIVELVQKAVNGVKSFLGLSPKNSAPKVDGSHANGLSSVPFDGYIAELHKG